MGAQGAGWGAGGGLRKHQAWLPLLATGRRGQLFSREDLGSLPTDSSPPSASRLAEAGAGLPFAGLTSSEGDDISEMNRF